MEVRCGSSHPWPLPRAGGSSQTLGKGTTVVSRINSFRATFQLPKIGVPFLATILRGRKARVSDGFSGLFVPQCTRPTPALARRLPQVPTHRMEGHVTGRLHFTFLLPRINAVTLKACGMQVYCTCSKHQPRGPVAVTKDLKFPEHCSMPDPRREHVPLQMSCQVGGPAPSMAGLGCPYSHSAAKWQSRDFICVCWLQCLLFPPHHSVAQKAIKPKSC